MTKCPRCFAALGLDTFAWVDRTPAQVAVDATASAYAGREVRMGAVSQAHRAEWGGEWPPKPEQPYDAVCPYCHFVLPPHWYFGDTTCITMAGARATGKTVYIAVLVKQLQRFAARLDREVFPVTEETVRRFRDEYEKPLFEDRGILEPTPRAALHGSYQHDPLIFNLGEWGGTRQYLVIRDVAGEDLEAADVGGPAWEFFSRADAVLFLFDPLRVGEVANQLRDLVPVSSNVGGDPRHVLQTVTRLIGSGNPRLAVILSKFDALQALSQVQSSAWGQVMGNLGAAFNCDPSLLGRTYDENDGLLLHEEVRSLLTRLDAGPGLTTMVNPLTGQQYEHRFFAVSALGTSPEGEKLSDRGISPFRVTDPVRWVLAAKNIMVEGA
ncbi:TRAFAC clade GTPase domain-containing protein [Gordonia sp. (in: high G+C Gram-positive bacteria)]|uniref:TRAFAC clade GTPase domain-containing protein n=1 Tax=Gordonia sp. (in: high G+C Gram-positive bacteria) TaxID=84139 RepID=UPI0039E2314A